MNKNEHLVAAEGQVSAAAPADERERFEALARKVQSDLYFDLRFDGDYKHGLVRDLWNFWQIFRASEGQAQTSAAVWNAAIAACHAEMVEDTGTEGDTAYNNAIVHCVEAIRAAQSADKPAGVDHE